MIEHIVLIKTYILEKYGTDGKLPAGFGARKVSRDDIKAINKILADAGIKVSSGTFEEVLTLVLSKYTSAVAQTTISEVGDDLSTYEDELEFETSGDLYEEAFRGAGTYEDYINKYSFELFKDTLVWLNAFLYASRDPFDKFRKNWDKYNNKVETVSDNMKNLILVEAVNRYNDYKYTSFTFVANRYAEPECLAIDGMTFSISELENVFPVHQHCRCSVILNK